MSSHANKAEGRSEGNMHTLKTGSHAQQLTSAAEKSQPLILVECVGCHQIGFSYSVHSEAEAPLNDGSISRYCHRCADQTVWRRVRIHPGVDDSDPSKQSPTRGLMEANDSIH